jgi:uncharacterized membrane protein YkvA (DUF1232 family)
MRKNFGYSPSIFQGHGKCSRFNIKNNLKELIMIITICLLILVYTILGKDVKPLHERLKGVNWTALWLKALDAIKKYAKKAGRLACTSLLQLWFVLNDQRTTTWEKAMIYAAIIYTVSPVSIIPAYIYRFLGILDEGAAIFYVINKVKDKMTPAIEVKVKDVLDHWFGPEYSVSDAKA